MAGFPRDNCYRSRSGDPANRRGWIAAGDRGAPALDPSAVADLSGLLVVVTTDRPKTLRKAMREPEIGRDTAPESERDDAITMDELNIRIAWRQRLELEDRAILRRRGHGMGAIPL
jgi:hypothetical protein